MIYWNYSYWKKEWFLVHVKFEISKILFFIKKGYMYNNIEIPHNNGSFVFYFL